MCSPLSSSSRFSEPSWTQSQKRVSIPILNSVALANAQNKERLKLKELFDEAYERCPTSPMEDISFTLEQFTTVLENYDFDSGVGTKKLSSRAKELHRARRDIDLYKQRTRAAESAKAQAESELSNENIRRFSLREAENTN
ncbi:30S ribosomal protein S1, chloroplastic [Sesbania bispinosa]|nr:30S ribosomal protein S1, chloroplastic [Sesbania bispinosa]